MIKIPAMRKIFLALLLWPALLFSQTAGPDTLLYKVVDTTHLHLFAFYPPEQLSVGKRPAMIFFFGGGWKGGNPDQFLHHARYFSENGIVCFLAEYRVETRNNTTPFQALEDAKSAMRFLRSNAGELGLDPGKIIAAGGSAGGHLAAATAFIRKYNAESDDQSISCIPNALVLFNPVIDNGPGGYGYERIGKSYLHFSPLHNIGFDAPPTIFFLGTEDVLIPVETAQYYRTVMQKTGSICELHLYKGEGHGFFNYNKPDNYWSTIHKTEKFLEDLGYILN